jgi:hypothetical protein
MFEANPENVAAIATMVTMRAFCRVVKTLYGGSTAEETAVSSFSMSPIMKLLLERSEVVGLGREMPFPRYSGILVRPMPQLELRIANPLLDPRQQLFDLAG